MGADIHDFAEVRRSDGQWEKVGAVFPNPYHDPSKPEEPPDEDGYVWNAKLIDHPYRRRNYSVFAILANVRNGYGFAGCDTGDGFNPIAMPKGLPRDATKDVLREYLYLVVSDDVCDQLEAKAEALKKDRGEMSGWRVCSASNAKRWTTPDRPNSEPSSTWWSKDPPMINGPDWHSASWLTVAELDAYDWQQRTKERGWVDPWNFELFRKNGKPSSWSGGVSGSSIDHISNAAMARLIDSGELQWEGDPPAERSLDARPYSTSLQRTMRGWPLKKGSVGAAIARPDTARHYTQVEWGVAYADCARDFLDRTMPVLRSLGAPDDVRMVFWFDN